jgi:hypothetical protein
MARTQDDSLGNWAFIHHADKSRWTWRQLKMDGSIELTSSPFSDFGAVVGDALKHGFRPKEHHWAVTNKNWTTHFQPGNPPISIPPGSPTAKHSHRTRALARLSNGSAHRTGRRNEVIR